MKAFVFVDLSQESISWLNSQGIKGTSVPLDKVKQITGLPIGSFVIGDLPISLAIACRRNWIRVLIVQNNSLMELTIVVEEGRRSLDFVVVDPRNL